MSISIDQNKCVGCRKCTHVCPGSLIKINSENKAFIKYEKDCWGCASCVKECKKEAISLYLGADIGGRGSKLTVETNENIVNWKIKETSGMEQVIKVDRKDSNKY